MGHFPREGAGRSRKEQVFFLPHPLGYLSRVLRKAALSTELPSPSASKFFPAPYLLLLRGSDPPPPPALALAFQILE